ncbi:2'-5' RNA ligase family protein [Neobacillus notoginsengisoli]|uniref:2'-5' RNA ligase family protein n=1 Tax=Neobacillus notoginsengisoli TaxID=1578198 RepID=A0A417Z089_9BACI|nr:2'-5' RNA ligase family protein [Neobacillus notoginsengisoli]RHW43368.1 2'-5' RNA ligase family protein [Neobacillus notoginsengisoli]
MKFFIGIVPPKEYKRKIVEFQTRWKNNLLSDLVEPHITIKSQGGLTSNKNWLRDVEKLCEDTAPFQLKINTPAFFDDTVLFLRVEARGINELHRKIVNAVNPEKDLIKKYRELDDYIPHLTLGQTHYGLSSEELKDMAILAEEELSPYPVFDVNFLRGYQEIESNKYKKFMDINLKEKS